MHIEIELNKDNSERVPYNSAEFPVYIQKRILSTYPNYAVISHWHDDIELIYVLSGQMYYNINDKQIILQAGEGVFVNTRQIHYGSSINYEECIFICVLFHPLLLCSSAYVEHQFILPVLQNECLPHLLLKKDDINQYNIMLLMKELLEITHSSMFALKTQELLFKLWENLFLLSGHTEKKQVPKNQHLTILKDMIHFINNHYTEKISLEDISSVGKISKTTCSSIFLKYTNQTPFSYLTEYRLRKSTELLVTTDLTISEICFEVGFSGSSYYSETFKKSYNCTPSQYRKKHILL